MTPRRYSLIFAGAVATLVLAIASYNLSVDPYSVFGTGLLSEEMVATTNHRVVMLRRYLAREDRVNAVIFGSSRAIAVSPALIEEALPGTRAHSFAVPAGTIEDHLPLLRWILNDPAGRAPREPSIASGRLRRSGCSTLPNGSPGAARTGQTRATTACRSRG